MNFVFFIGMLVQLIAMADFDLVAMGSKMVIRNKNLL